jgi:hypothetical protein
LSKHWNVITFTPTADTLHVQVPVARIGNFLNDLAVYFFRHNKLFLILRFFFLQRTTSRNTLWQCYKLEL